MLERIFFILIILFSIMYTPWYVYMFLFIFSIFLYKDFYEVFPLAILTDLSFGPVKKIFFLTYEINIYFFYTISVLILFLLVIFLRDKKNLF